MTILNNYSQLYWLTRLDGIKGIFIGLMILCIICFIFSLFHYDWVKTFSYERTEEKIKNAKGYIKKSVIFSIVFSICVVFIPSKKEVIFIYAGGKTMDFIDSDTSINKIPAQTTKIITDYLEKQIKETNEDGRNK